MYISILPQIKDYRNTEYLVNIDRRYELQLIIVIWYIARVLLYVYIFLIRKRKD